MARLLNLFRLVLKLTNPLKALAPLMFDEFPFTTSICSMFNAVIGKFKL